MTKTIDKIKRKSRQAKDSQILSQKSNSSLTGIALDGVTFQTFTKLTKSIPLSLHEWSNYLSLSERTLQRYSKENLKFNSLQSGKIVEIVRLYQKGKDVFDNIEDFDVWLKSDCMALGGIKPEDLIGKPFGIEALEDELGRIEWGIFA